MTETVGPPTKQAPGITQSSPSRLSLRPPPPALLLQQAHQRRLPRRASRLLGGAEKRPTDATRHRSNNRRGSVGALLASAETTGTPGRQVVPAQRQALVLRGDGAALGRGRNARSRTPVPQGDRLDPAAAARDRDRTPTPPSPAQPPTDPGGRDRSHCVTITPGPSSPKFHDGRGNLRAGAPLLCSRREV